MEKAAKDRVTRWPSLSPLSWWPAQFESLPQVELEKLALPATDFQTRR